MDQTSRPQASMNGYGDRMDTYYIATPSWCSIVCQATPISMAFRSALCTDFSKLRDGPFLPSIARFVSQRQSAGATVCFASQRIAALFSRALDARAINGLEKQAADDSLKLIVHLRASGCHHIEDDYDQCHARSETYALSFTRTSTCPRHYSTFRWPTS